MKVFKKIIKLLSITGIIKYCIAIILFKKKVPIFINTIWTFKIKKWNAKIKVRPYSADIYLIRALVLGKNLDGKGEYDFSVTPQPVNILDLGANIGFFSIIAAKRYKCQQLIAVEPEYENYKMLLLNTNDYECVKCINEGIWSKNTNLELIAKDRGTQGYRFDESSKETLYHAISINEIIEQFELSSIDIVKMDIEGSENNVFDENLEWIDKTKCLVIETHDKFIPGTSKKIEAIMFNSGFQVTRCGENEIYYRAQEIQISQCEN